MSVFLTSKLGSADWINCNWTTARRENKTQFKRVTDDLFDLANGKLKSANFVFHISCAMYSLS
jgi:hypothetical protein